MSVFRCDITYKKIKGNSLASTKNQLVAHGLLNKYNIILDHKKFRAANTELSNLASEKLGRPVRLYREEIVGKDIQAYPIKEVFQELDGKGGPQPSGVAPSFFEMPLPSPPPSDFERDINFFRGDRALMEQEVREQESESGETLADESYEIEDLSVSLSTPKPTTPLAPETEKVISKMEEIGNNIIQEQQKLMEENKAEMEEMDSLEDNQKPSPQLNLTPSLTERPIKPGVAELFESNPELANAVYEALRFKSFDTKGVSLDTKERDGWKWIKLNGKNIGEVKLVKNDRRSKEVGLSIKLNEEYQNKGYGQIVHTLVADWAKNEFGDTLYSDFDNSQAEINTLLALTKKGYAEQIGDYGTQKDGRYSTDVRAFRIKTSDEIGTITPQQKQQAQQLYSQYLESLNKPNANPILKGNQQEQVKKFAQLQERLNNKEFLEGAKSAYESTPALQQLSTQEEYSDYIARVSLGIIKNPSSGEYNYASQVKDIVYRGSEKEEGRLFQYFTKNSTEAYMYAKANITKGGNITERNPIPVIKNNVAEKYNLSKNILWAITDTQLGVDGLEFEGLISKDEADEARRLINKNKDIQNLQKLIELYPSVSVESESDLMKQFDDDEFIKNKSKYDKIRKELDSFFSREQVGKITIALLNIKNPYTEEIVQEDLQNDRDAYKNGHDGAFLMDGNHFLVKSNTEQIHILGSKQDIEGFREFVNKSSNVQTLKGKLDGSKLSEVEGKLEANKDRLIELLGSSMYSEKLKDVVYKELLQNAFDATKIAESKGLINKGKIDIEINEKERIISFTDNGIGMTPDIVQKAFFTIGGTYKGEDVDNKLKSGGLGLAKMAFIFGSEKLILETVSNGIKTTVDATSQEIRADNFKIKSEQTNQKNGTKVSVKIPKTYVDSKGENREIDFPKYLDIEFKYSFLANPLIGNVDINYSIVNREFSYTKEEKLKTNLGDIPEGFVLFSPAKTSFADMDIYIDTKNITRGSFVDTKHKILSSGLYQFDVSFKKDNDENIPLNIIIDIKPKVDPTNAQYPFNNQRENFKPTVKNDIGALNKYLALLWQSIEIELLKSSFNKIKNIDAVDVENVDNSVIAKNKEITKSFAAASNSDIIKTAIEDFNKKNKEAIINNGGLKTEQLSLTKEDIDKDAEKAYSRTFKAEKEISINKETGLNLDSNKPIIHNNTDMTLDEKSTKFLSEISSIMIEYKKSIIDFYGEDYSSNIKNQLWGVSIDKNYGGINVNPSFLNMLAINPFYNFPTNPKVDAVNYIAVALDHLIIHELNHNFVRNEGAQFTGRFLQTYSEIHSLPNHFELVSKLKLSIKNNLETIKKLNYEYQQSENVESGFEGNKIEDNNQRRADIGIKSISKNDSDNNVRTTINDRGSSEKFGEIINSNILGTKQDIEGFRDFVSEQSQTQFSISPDINYDLKASNIVLNNLNKIKQWESNKSIDQNTLWKKISELGIPKQQLELLRESEGNTVEEKLTNFVANYSYTVEINTAKEKAGTTTKINFEENPFLDEADFQTDGGSSTQYYSNLTVPGGTNYTENEIATPAITPFIKGHAQFATDKGIGWFRSDDKTVDEFKGNWVKNESELPNEFVFNGERYYKEYGEWQTKYRTIEDIETVIWRYNMSLGNKRIQNKPDAKTRRILEVQSDLFQKGRDKESLISSTKNILQDEFSVSQEPDGSWSVLRNNPFEVIKSKLSSKEEAKKEVLNITNKDKENQFLQLLNKDNNWVTFFVKSIIQDSAKKGYEKVLFPTGNTASKVEGHQSLEEFKKQKENAIKNTEQEKTKVLNMTLEEAGSKFFNPIMFNSKTKEEQQEFINNHIATLDKQINTFKQELETVEREGFGALRPIYNFYENTVANVLKKQGYNPVLITDEFGNTWNEIQVDSSRDLSKIEFNLSKDTNQITQPITPRKGITELFAVYPKLASIGTEEQYERYLRAVFPNTDANYILYHGTPNKEAILKEGYSLKNVGNKPNKAGIFFYSNPEEAAFIGDYLFNIVNITNPLSTLEGRDLTPEKVAAFEDQGIDGITIPLNPNLQKEIDKLRNNPPQGFSQESIDSIIASWEKEIKEGLPLETIVFRPSQVHILGTEDDANRFSQFVAKTAEEPMGQPLVQTPMPVNLNKDTAARDVMMNQTEWFEQTIQPLIQKMSQLFPQIKSEVISEKDLELLDKRISDKIKALQAKGKQVNSFFDRGKVYVIKERVTKDIVIEEFLHPFINALEVENPELYKSLLLQAKKLFPALKESVFSIYEGVYDNTFDLNREFLTQALSMEMSKQSAFGDQPFQNERQEEVKSLLDRFIDFLKGLFNRLFNKTQVEKYDINLETLDVNMSLSELATLMLSPTAKVQMNTTRMKGNKVMYFNLSPDKASYYLSQGKTASQKEIIAHIINADHEVTHIRDPHSYEMMGTSLTSVTTHLETLSPYQGEKLPEELLKQYSDFGHLIHDIAELVNIKGQEAFKTEDREADLNNFLKAYDFSRYIYTSQNQDANRIKREIAEFLINYMKVLKSKGSVLISEVSLGDIDSQLGGKIDLIEITKEGTVVIHDFKTIAIGQKALREAEGDVTQAAQNQWQLRKSKYRKQLSLYRRLLEVNLVNKNVSISDNLQIVPIFYLTEIQNITQETGEIVPELYTLYSDEKSSLLFGIEPGEDAITGERSLNKASDYQVKYNRKEAQSERNIPLTKEEKAAFKDVSPEQQYKRKMVSEVERMANSERLNQSLNDIFILLERTTKQFQNSENELKRELYEIFQQGGEVESAATKAAIELVIKNQNNPDFQKVLVNYLNFVQESQVGIDNLYQNFVVSKSYGDSIYEKDAQGNVVQDANGNPVLNPQEIYNVITRLNKIKEFSKAYQQVFEEIVADLQDVPNDNLFKQMAQNVLATTKNIENSFYDTTITLQAKLLSEQINEEFRQKMVNELQERLKQKKERLNSLPPNSRLINSLKRDIDEIEQQITNWGDTTTFVEKVLKGQMGDASFFYSNFIANLSNPDMVLATSTGLLKSLFNDLRIFTVQVRETYGEQFDKLIAVKGDKRDQVKLMQERLTTEVNFRLLKFDNKGNPIVEEWKQLGLLTEVDENVYYEHQKLIDEIEIIRNNPALSEDERTAALKKARMDLKQFEEVNFESYYNEEYQKIMNSIDRDFVMSDNTVVNAKELVETKFEKIRMIHASYNPKDVKQGNMSNEDLDTLKQLWREYNNLFSDIDLNGNTKIGGELQMAQALRKKREKLRETRKDTPNVKLWAKYREEIKFQYGDNSEQLKQWDKLNSVRRTTDEYRKAQQEIRDQITAILNRGGRTEQLNLDINKKWETIFNLLRPYQDNVDKFDIDNVPPAVIEKVTKLESEIYELQRQFKASIKESPELALTPGERKSLNNLYEELANMDEYTTTDKYEEDYGTALEAFTAQYNTINNTSVPSQSLIGKFEQESEWFLKNHIRKQKDITSFDGHTTTIVEVVPAYHYRQTVPRKDTVEYQGQTYPTFELVPAIQYTTYSNEAMRNPDYYDEFKRRKVKTSSLFYKPEAYRQLERGATAEDKAYFEVAQFLKQEMIAAQQGLHSSNKIGFAIPTTERSLWDRIMQGEFKDSFRNLKRAFVPNEQDITKGYQTSQKKVLADLTGEETKFVPVMYTQKVDIADQSYDVFKSILQFRFSTEKAKMLQSKQDFYEVLGDTLDHHVPTDPLKKEALVSGMAERLGISNRTQGLVKGLSNTRANTMRALIDRFFYEEYKKNLIDVETEVFGFKLKFTDGKVVDSILSFAGWNMMFLNIPNWIVNFLSGNIQALIESATGVHFTAKTLGEGKLETRNIAMSVFEDRSKIYDKSLHSQLIDLYEPVQGTFENEFGEKTSWSMRRNLDTVFFAGKSFGEWELQISMWVAMMKSKKVIQTLPDGSEKVISLWEAYEKGKDGIPKLKEGVQFSKKQFDSFVNALHGVNKALNGNYAKFDQTVAEKWSLMRAAFFMKKFLLPLYINRFGAFRPDLEMGQPREGYYMTFFKTILADLFIYKQNVWKKYKDGEYTDLQKQNIQKFMREQMFVFGLSIFLLALGYYDDEDEEEAAEYAQFLTLKLRRELWSTTPIPGLGLSEFINVVETPFIAMNSVKNVGKLGTLGLQHIGNTVSGGSLFEKELYYQRRSGFWEQGDSKFLATLLKTLGIKVNITDPEELLKGYKFQMLR